MQSKKAIVKSTTPGVSRRNFMKSVAAGGAGALAAGLAGSLEAYAAAQEKADEARAKAVSPMSGEPFKFNDKFQRYNLSNHAFNQIGRDIGMTWNRAAAQNLQKYVLNGQAGKDIPAGSVGMARIYTGISAGMWNTSAPYFRTGMGYENKGALSWTSMTYPFLGPDQRTPDITDPVPLTRYTKAVARMMGADQVGVAPFDPHWVYSHTQRNPYQPGEPVLKEIRIADVPMPGETDDALLFPADCKSVIVMVFGMNRTMIQTSPGYAADGIVGMGYTRMAVASTGLAEFIRTQGYWAIPSNNDLGLSVPIGVQAGLGEVGRHGLLITPEFASNIRISRVYTNMPMQTGKPIEFGVQSFCESCMKCARECPSKAITEGPKTWEALNECNNPGTFKWYNDMKKCMHFWIDNGVCCSNCLAVCPFTKGEMWAHGATEWSINQMPFANGIWLGLDDAFGYGERRDLNEIWGDTVAPYGLDDELVSKRKRANGGA